MYVQFIPFDSLCAAAFFIVIEKKKFMENFSTNSKVFLFSSLRFKLKSVEESLSFFFTAVDEENLLHNENENSHLTASSYSFKPLLLPSSFVATNEL